MHFLKLIYTKTEDCGFCLVRWKRSLKAFINRRNSYSKQNLPRCHYVTIELQIEKHVL